MASVTSFSFENFIGKMLKKGKSKPHQKSDFKYKAYIDIGVSSFLSKQHENTTYIVISVIDHAEACRNDRAGMMCVNGIKKSPVNRLYKAF